MMHLYGTAVVRERSMTGHGAEIERYLRWEYGEGTGVGLLNGRAIRRLPSRTARRFRIMDRLGGLSASVKARVAAKVMDGWGRELTLLVQWKRGDLETLELVDRLEALQRSTGSPTPSPDP